MGASGRAILYHSVPVTSIFDGGVLCGVNAAAIQDVSASVKKILNGSVQFFLVFIVQ